MHIQNKENMWSDMEIVKTIIYKDILVKSIMYGDNAQQLVCISQGICALHINDNDKVDRWQYYM